MRPKELLKEEIIYQLELHPSRLDKEKIILEAMEEGLDDFFEGIRMALDPLVRKFFDQVAAGRIDAAYGLTTKTYKTHVKRQDFLKFLAGLNLNKYRNLKSGRPRVQEDQIIITLNLKSEDKKDELPLDLSLIHI